MKNSTGKLKQIEGMRGLAAITVFIWHTHILIDAYFPFKASILFRGDIANVFFFMLSGFLVTWGGHYSYKNIDGLLFIRGRLKKIYLLWSISTIYMLCFNIYTQWKDNAPVNIPALSDQCIKHLLLIQSWFPYNNASNELNGPGWFLSVLLFCWLITKPLLGIYEFAKKKIGKYAWGLCFWGLLFGYIIYIIIYPYQNNFFKGIFVYWCSFTYGMGMLLGKEIYNINHRLNKLCTTAFQMFLFFLFIIALILTNKAFAHPCTYLYLVFFFFWVIVFIVSRSNECITNKILANNVLVKLGGVSSEIYVIHVPVCKTITHYMSCGNGILQFVIVVITTIIVIVVYRLIVRFFRQVFYDSDSVWKK